MRDYLRATFKHGERHLKAWCDPRSVRELIERHISGSVDAYRKISALLTLILWQDSAEHLGTVKATSTPRVPRIRLETEAAPGGGGNGPPEIDVSVIIPTRNRAESLREALACLARQETGEQFTYEVVVVDNGSVDHTRQVVEALEPTFSVPLRYVHEARLGIPWARNAGIRVARGTILVCTDDDVLAQRDWLSAIHRCMREEGADAVGGRVLPWWVDGRPEWMTEQVIGRLRALGCLDFGEERRVMCDGDRQFWWVGSNLAVTRRAIERLGAFDARFARGEDRELFHRYHAGGATLVYEPRALVYHKVGKERLTPGYFRRWYWQTGRYHAVGIPWHPHHVLTAISLYAYRDILRWVFRWVRACVRGEGFWSRLACECQLRAALGLVVHRLTEWPGACRGYAGAALMGLRRHASLLRLAVAKDATVRALGRALLAVAWRRRSCAEASWVRRIEALRAELNASTQEIHLENYGVARPDARSSDGSVSVTTVGETCRRTSKPPQAAQLLMAIVRRLRPQHCLELGTSLGISGAYQAAGLEVNGEGRLVTLEGAAAKAELARRHFKRLGLGRVAVVTGRFQDTLSGALEALSRVDVAFIDGHHDEHATVAYFERIVPQMLAGGVLIFDDIEWSTGMRRAWRSVQADARVRATITLDDMGLCVVGASRGRARHVRVPLSL